MRDAVVQHFLDGTPWSDWTRTALAGDASGRSYLRLRRNGTSVIVMDAPPEAGEDVRPFIRIATHLADMGLCPPQILTSDPELGLLVLEDLGPNTVAEWLEDRPEDEHDLYAAATDVLVRINGQPAPAALIALTPDVAAQMTDLFAEWYAPHLSTAKGTAIGTALWRALSDHGGAEMGLSLRDYHAENLIWRPHLSGTDRIGLLDFQDAVLAPPAYDLVSLLRDPRRRVDSETTNTMIDRFIAATGADTDAFRAAFAVWSVQRNLRILGIFARLARRDGKLRYQKFVPLVREHLLTDLKHPALGPLRGMLAPLVAEETHYVT